MSDAPLMPDLGNLARLSDATTRVVTAENVYGRAGAGGRAEVSDTPPEDVARIGQPWDRSGPARELGTGWKVRPFTRVPPGQTVTILDVDGPGVIQHIWITLAEKYLRDVVLRMYWDGEAEPSVEVPVGDFFCNGWAKRADFSAQPMASCPSGGLNGYLPMPFGRSARFTVENRAPHDEGLMLFYAITYAETPVADGDGRFHAQFRRTNPLPYGEVYTLLDGVTGKGHYVGTYLAWQQNSAGWWGEGEIKFFLDGDAEYPSICGTGTEDYFGGAWGFGRTYCSPYLGYILGGRDEVGTRHGLYRFHVCDPIRFKQDLRVTIQALGWRGEGRYLPLRDDIASVAYWYQAEPHASFPPLPSRDELEVV